MATLEEYQLAHNALSVVLGVRQRVRGNVDFYAQRLVAPDGMTVPQAATALANDALGQGPLIAGVLALADGGTEQAKVVAGLPDVSFEDLMTSAQAIAAALDAQMAAVTNGAFTSVAAAAAQESLTLTTDATVVSAAIAATQAAIPAFSSLAM